MRPLLTVMIAVMVGASVFASHAEAGDRRGRHHSKHSRGVVVYESRHGGYYRPRDVVVIRDHYRPYYRPVAVDVNRYYYRGGYLPPGWHRRIRPVPVYLEPELVVVPRGYRRGIIDGRAVVYNDRGFLLDVAVLF